MVSITKDERGVYTVVYTDKNEKTRDIKFTLDSFIFFDVSNGEFIVDYDDKHEDVKLTGIFDRDMSSRVDFIYLKFELKKILMDEPEKASHILHVDSSVLDDTEDIFFNKNKIMIMCTGDGKVKNGDNLEPYRPHIVKFASCFGFKLVNGDTYNSILGALEYDRNKGKALEGR